MKILKDLKDFITKGNLIEIAVGLVMALAFTAVINALVNNVLMPLIAAIFGKPSFDDLTATLNESVIPYGTFITAVVTFLLIVAAFFFVVKPYNAWKARRAKAEEAAPAPPPRRSSCCGRSAIG